MYEFVDKFTFSHNYTSTRPGITTRKYSSLRSCFPRIDSSKAKDVTTLNLLSTSITLKKAAALMPKRQTKKSVLASKNNNFNFYYLLDAAQFFVTVSQFT